MINRKLMFAALLILQQASGRQLKEESQITQCDLKNREFLKTRSGKCRMRCSKNYQTLKRLKKSKKKRCRNISKKMCRIRRREYVSRRCTTGCRKEGYVFVKSNKACVKGGVVAKCMM